MNALEIVEALGLPDSARVDHRVPKTLLLEHGAPTASDKRLISKGIERATWIAALKPTTIGVATYRDEVRQYLEIAILHVILRPVAKPARLVELIHRAIPYPTLAVAEQEDSTHLSLAHKRQSQSEIATTVIDGGVLEVAWPRGDDDECAAEFLTALALERQPRGTLFALYQGWVAAVLALQAARRTGIFAPPDADDGIADRRSALEECERLEAEMARLRTAAAKEKQIARQVELNTHLKRAETAHAAALKRI